MEKTIENTLRIDPDTGAVVINDTLRIEPEWTFEALVNSEAYKKYAYIEVIDEIRSLLVDSIAGNSIIVDVSLTDAKIDRIEIKIAHANQAEYMRMSMEDFIALRKIMYDSFSGYNSEKDKKQYISYDFPWGFAIASIDQREKTSDLYISYKRV